MEQGKEYPIFENIEIVIRGTWKKWKILSFLKQGGGGDSWLVTFYHCFKLIWIWFSYEKKKISDQNN